MDVSIHTPTQGVTVDDMGITHDSDVSIHTPTQGVTLAGFGSPDAILGFNPHTHAGCDWRVPKDGEDNTGFNPHTHAGCDEVKTMK